MTAKPRKPLMVNVLWTVGLFATILAAYVGSFAAVHWMSGSGLISGETCDVFRNTLYRPILWWESADLPGGGKLRVLAEWSYFRGAGDPGWSWSDLASIRDQ